MITGHAAAVNVNGSVQGYVRCGIKGGGGELVRPGQLSGFGDLSPPHPAHGAWVRCSRPSPSTSSESFTADFFCRQNNIDTAYVEATRLMAIGLGSVTMSGDA